MKYPAPRIFLPVFLALSAAWGNAATPGGATTESTLSASTALTGSNIQAEMDRVVNLNRVRDFSVPVCPFEHTPIGIDARNGRVLAFEYFRWDNCRISAAIVWSTQGHPRNSIARR